MLPVLQLLPEVLLASIEFSTVKGPEEPLYKAVVLPERVLLMMVTAAELL
jgi:hypothetical protein